MAQKFITSEEQQLIWADIKKWGYNALVFSSPAVLVGLVALQSNAPKVAFFIFAKELYTILVDLYKKWAGEAKYKA